MMDLSGCKNLEEIPDLSKAINLVELNLSRCERLKELPDLSKAISLTSLNLSGCSWLRNFPQLSTSIEKLYLDNTAIEEVPSWIENITGLTRMWMTGCQKLRTISATIWNLKHLELVNFTKCGGITSISDASMVKTVAELHAESIENHPMDMYPSWSFSNTEVMFCDCFNLDRDAEKFILQSDSRNAVLPGKGVPTYFTHRTCESSLIVPLPQSSLSQNKLGFTACILPGPVNLQVIIIVHWKFRGVTGVCNIELASYIGEDKLVIFHFDFCPQVEVQCPPSQLACNNVEFEFELRNTGICKDLINSPKIKGCGVRVLNVSPSQDDNDKSSETEHTDLSGENDEESGRSKKRIRISLGINPTEV